MVVLLVAAASYRGALDPEVTAILVGSVAGAAFLLLLVTAYLWRRGDLPASGSRLTPAANLAIMATVMSVGLSFGAVGFVVAIGIMYVPQIPTHPFRSIGSILVAVAISAAVMGVGIYTVRAARDHCRAVRRRTTREGREAESLSA